MTGPIEFLNGKVTLHLGDCLDALRALPDSSIDSCVTDPPYALVSIVKRFGGKNAAPAKEGVYGRSARGFMGKEWDTGERAFAVEFWAEVLRVLKPGGHVLAFGGTRTYHRLACAIEDAGFEIRDQIGWLYGSGFPKSHDVSKGIEKMRVEDVEPVRRVCRFIRAAMDARGLKSRDLVEHFGGCHSRLIDHWAARDTDSQPSLPTPDQWTTLKAALDLPDEMDAEVARLNARKGEFGAAWHAREVTGEAQEWRDRSNYAMTSRDGMRRDAAATDTARQWQGWGTALKPSQEPLVLARKPYTNQQEWVTIAALIDDLEGRLWSMLSANVAEVHFGLSQSEFAEACGFALWSAEERSNTSVDLSEAMGTSRFELATITSLSTVLSWRRTLAEIWRHANTCTIATELSTTTDWKTLRSCLLEITPRTIIPDHNPALALSASASPAARYFCATVAQLHGTLEQHALARAIELSQEACRGVGAKPSLNPLVVARKPLEGTVAANVLAHGTGALNIDGCRVGTDENRDRIGGGTKGGGGVYGESVTYDSISHSAGRWPANICHDGSEEVLAAFPESAGQQGDVRGNEPSRTGDENTACYGEFGRIPFAKRSDSGSAARFFYTAKADADDRIGSKHPTVKPINLMRYLVRLVTPPGGVVLDPFAGTGTTGQAAFLEGFRAVLVEREAEYQADIARRMELVLAGPDERARALVKASGRLEDAGPLFAGGSA